MNETHTWVKHRDTGLFWQCPDEVLSHFELLGWEPTDERPEEPNPAVDERRAWEAEQAHLAEEEVPAAKSTKSKSTTKAAASGDPEE